MPKSLIQTKIDSLDISTDFVDRIQKHLSDPNTSIESAQRNFTDTDYQDIILIDRDFLTVEKISFQSLRDKLIGQKNFEERSYNLSLPIETIGNLVLEFLRNSGFVYSIRKNNEQCEVAIGLSNQNIYLFNLDHSKIVANINVAYSGDGFRVSFINTLSLGALLEGGAWTLGTGIFSLPVAAVIAATHAFSYMDERVNESLFWNFMDSKVHSLSSSHFNEISPILGLDVSEKLEKLWKLVNEGALTIEEYQAQKQKLLSD